MGQQRFEDGGGDYDTAEELLRAAGAEIVPYQRRIPPPPGDATHEVGTARMGVDPKNFAAENCK